MDQVSRDLRRGPAIIKVFRSGTGSSHSRAVVRFDNLVKQVETDGVHVGGVSCELTELLRALGAQDYGFIAGYVYARGKFGLTIRLGKTNSNTPVWHILSQTELNVVYAKTTEFVTGRLNSSVSQLGLRKCDGLAGAFEEGVVRIGVLLNAEVFTNSLVANLSHVTRSSMTTVLSQT
jgi:hypothetical protein